MLEETEKQKQFQKRAEERFSFSYNAKTLSPF